MLIQVEWHSGRGNERKKERESERKEEGDKGERREQKGEKLREVCYPFQGTIKSAEQCGNRPKRKKLLLYLMISMISTFLTENQLGRLFSSKIFLFLTFMDYPSPLVSFVSSPSYLLAKYLLTWFNQVADFKPNLLINSSFEVISDFRKSLPSRQEAPTSKAFCPRPV